LLFWRVQRFRLRDRVKGGKDDDNLLSAVTLIVALTCGPAPAAEFATKEQAVAMVKKAVTFIKKQGPDKAYVEISDKGGSFHDRDLYITVLDLKGKVLAYGQNENLIGQDSGTKRICRSGRSMSD
jgi:hypothetical protein